ncbi:V-type ATP synthase subunit F [Acholeplasma oculi]|uniref:V-type ATP synthase subunit F n=1 Tax=Acholeplasma oculi TaxID=35623 RepID=A0A061AAH6_9MOLU|nr:V-type ATP synthase subunit F [Acholeplasma oculi]CDR30394.1 V-type ATP synthase subunit F [Acholeplasma oculi]SKC41800.1 V/A-type H+-transporting ATPase subunit F [Acholeplasma oculi]SUT88934.1 V-type ATP synthase subunit F [Acholeplasma oculi]
MRFYLLSDNVDTLVGMRLVGIEGDVLHTKDELLKALDFVMQDESIAICLLTTKVVLIAPDVISELKLRNVSPLFVEIPDRHGNSNIGDAIDAYVSKAIGVKL